MHVHKTLFKLFSHPLIFFFCQSYILSLGRQPPLDLSHLPLNYLGGVGPLHAGEPPRADGHPGGGVYLGGAGFPGAGENFSAVGSFCCGSVWAQLEAC